MGNCCGSSAASLFLPPAGGEVNIELELALPEQVTPSPGRGSDQFSSPREARDSSGWPRRLRAVTESTVPSQFICLKSSSKNPRSRPRSISVPSWENGSDPSPTSPVLGEYCGWQGHWHETSMGAYRFIQILECMYQPSVLLYVYHSLRR